MSFDPACFTTLCNCAKCQAWRRTALKHWETTRTDNPGAIVFLHASKALWSGWRDLWWAEDIDVPRLPRGGVIGVARLQSTGGSDEMIPPRERTYFKVGPFPGRDCADVQCLWFGPPRRLKFYPCRGTLVPTRKVPPVLLRRLPVIWLDPPIFIPEVGA